MLVKCNNVIPSINGVKMGYDPYNPLRLPPFTIRIKFTDNIIPSFEKGVGRQVSAIPNIWDLTYNNTDWTEILYLQKEILEILGANTTGVVKFNYAFHHCEKMQKIVLFDTSTATIFSDMFNGCYKLKNVPLFDLSNANITSEMFNACNSIESVPLFDLKNVEKTHNMFAACKKLKTVPLFDLSNVKYADYMFRACEKLETLPNFNLRNCLSIFMFCYGCYELKTIPDIILAKSGMTSSSAFAECRKIDSGIISMYNKLSRLISDPYYHQETFKNCGIDTVTGAAELAQIPDDWK